MRVERLTGRVLVDTNVLIYATLAADPRHRQALEVLALRREDIPVIVTENDKDFAGIDGITALNPFH